MPSVLFLAFSFVGGTKVAFEVFGPKDADVGPPYLLALAIALGIAGLLDAAWRGLVVSALAAVSAAIGGVALVVLSRGRWDVFTFATPMTLVGAAGLGMFVHGILHSSPSVVRVGFKVILGGFLVAVIVVLVGEAFLRIRHELHGTDPAIIGLAGVALLSLFVTPLCLMVGLREHRREAARRRTT